MTLTRILKLRQSSFTIKKLCSTSTTTVSKPSLESLKFWKNASKDIDWITPPEQVFATTSRGDPFYDWFPNGSLNLCFNAVDRHVLKGRGDAVALIYDSPITKSIHKMTYKELQRNVEALSALLLDLSVSKGDRVLIYIPNMLESVIAMLACVRIGAIHSVVFGGFAATEIATRIKDCKPKVVICTSCGLEGAKVIPYKEYVDTAIKLAENEHKVKNVLVLQRKELPNPDMIKGRDIFWGDSIQPFLNNKVPCVSMQSTDPSYILYTSGTTGQPKGVLRDTGGYAVALRWSMTNIFDIKESDVFWAASDVGWVVGHSFTVYGPLLLGCASVIYEGKPVSTPDAANFWRTIARHRVNALFTAPTALRAIKREDPHGTLVSDFDVSSLRTLFLAGERADSDSIKWAEKILGVPVRDHWWQTESGWPMCANIVGKEGYLPIKYGSVFRAVPGYDLRVMNENNTEVGPNTIGALVVKLPLPPGCFQTLYNNDTRFIESYFKRVPGYYNTGDDGMIDDDGYVSVMSRHDDVINVAGHRISTGAIEEVLSSIPHVAEVAVFGVADTFRGQLPLGLLVLNSATVDQCDEKEVIREAIERVRQQIGAFAVFKKAVVVTRLPKTRSGKILRGALRSLANRDPNFKVPVTCDDPKIFEEIDAIIKLHEDIPSEQSS